MALSILVVPGCVLAQQGSATYQLTDQDVKRIRERADVLRLSGVTGWEAGYNVLAIHEWRNGELDAALNRLILIQTDGENYLEKELAMRFATEHLFALESSDPKRSATLRRVYAKNVEASLLEGPVSAPTSQGGNNVHLANTLNDAKFLWERSDQGVLEKIALRELAVAESIADAGSAASVRISGYGTLEAIATARGKYADAIGYLDQGAALLPLITLTNEARALATESIATTRVGLLARYQPGTPAAREALEQRIEALKVGSTVPWTDRVALFESLKEALEAEGTQIQRIDAAMHLLQSAPTPVASAEQAALETSLLSSLQGAATFGRSDAALYAYDRLIAREADMLQRESLIQTRGEIAARAGR